MKITKVMAREIFDSRGMPTVQCDLLLDDKVQVSASVPSGISKSFYEAVELRDGADRLLGQGVTRAVENIENIIGGQILGKEPNGVEMDLQIIALDGTEDKSYLGANATLAASMAIYKAQAIIEELELYELISYIFGSQSVALPFPMFNMINGGAHANNNLQIQEFMVVPVGATNFRDSMEVAFTIFHEIKDILNKRGVSIAVGDEGGFAPFFKDDFEALDIINQAIEIVSEKTGSRCVIALDIAATQFYDTQRNSYLWARQPLAPEELLNVYSEMIKKYPIYSIEDPFAQDDWTSWTAITKALDDKVQIVGDDIFATNLYRISQGVDKQVANAAVIKPNQVGTITESLHAIKLCKAAQMGTVISHRSGETCDTFIADLAVGTSSGQIKAGGFSRGERLAKYNRLLKIEDDLTLSLLNS